MARNKQSDMRYKVTTGYLERHPDMAGHTLARLMRKEQPKLYSTHNAALHCVRYQRGANGVQCRKQLTDRRFTVKTKKAIPESRARKFTPYYIANNSGLGLILPDIHIPFHCVDAVDIAIKAGKKAKVKWVLILGDMIDCYQLSRFMKDPRERDFAFELHAAKEFLDYLQSQLPNAKIIYKQGNHEDRFERYLASNAPALIGVEEFRWEVLLGLHQRGIDWIPDKRVIYCGYLNLLHGHEYLGGGGISPARSIFLKANECSMVANFHRTSMFSKPTIRERPISCWSVGCLCYLHPDFLPLNDWNQGFALVDSLPDQNFIVHNKRIINGEVV